VGPAQFAPGVPPEVRSRAVVVERELITMSGAPACAVVDPETKKIVGGKFVQAVPVVEYWGHFSTAKAFFGLEVWRFVSFQFLHANLTHLVMNMFGLYFVGPLVEQYLGRKRYLAYYLTCGVFGALMYLLLNVMGYGLLALKVVASAKVPGLLFDDTYTPLVGASAGIFGILMAAAFIAPNAIVQVMFVIPMRMRTAVYAFVAIAAGSLILGSSNAGGEAAHLGGAAAGAFFIRRMHLLRDFFDVLGDSRGPKTGPVKAATVTRAGPPTQEQVDRVLAKVSAGGIASLSEAEKEILKADTLAKRERGG
jgi:membrane associated rhomboid family serine protease